MRTTKISFKQNIGNTDRLIRIAIGILLMLLVFYNIVTSNILRNLLIITSTVLLIEGVIGY
ncbi:YgaP family membrane protein [Anaerovirgula multivorans]|uniref:YgaP family membrane protein n=1 Tax=Anaerovirgula multivorans TaxID=312168 RepID=UPI000B774877